MRTLAKVFALPVLCAVAFVAYAYVSLYFAGYLFPRVVPRPYVEMMSAAVVGSLAAAAVSAWPMFRLYASRAWLAAVAVASPFVVIRVSDLLHYAGRDEPRIMVMSVFEMLAYPGALLLAVWAIAQLSERSKRAV